MNLRSGGNLGGKSDKKVARKKRLFTAKRKQPLKITPPKLDENKWVSTPKQITTLKNKLLKQQQNICPILKEPIIKPCLDHDHVEGYVRGVIGSRINLFEGQVTKLWGKYLSDHTDISLSNALRNLADYLEVDHQDSILHSGIIKDQQKALKRMTKETLVRRAKEDLGLVFNLTMPSSEMIETYLEAFRDKLENQDVYGIT